MLDAEQHLDNLLRHIGLVREACTLLGKRLIAKGRPEFGRILISKGFTHDVSKFSGIEYDYLHNGNDIPKECLEKAIRQHVLTNAHHPEYWGGFDQMPEIAIAEMVADIYARAQEFGTCLRDWIKGPGEKKYNFKKNDYKYNQLIGFVDLLLDAPFTPPTE